MTACHGSGTQGFYRRRPAPPQNAPRLVALGWEYREGLCDACNQWVELVWYPNETDPTRHQILARHERTP